MKLTHCVVIGAIVGLDQLSKYMVRANIEPAEMAHDYGIVVIPRIFDIVFVKNTGAAFSILKDQAGFLVVFNLLVIIAMLLFMVLRAKVEAPRIVYGIALVVAGGIGNLIDRVTLGFVTDFFDFHVFPVFNVADISVCVGCGLVILHMVTTEFARNKSVKEPVE